MEGKELRRRRMSLGLTQTALAKILEIQPNTISRYETGINNIPRLFEIALEGLECMDREKQKDKSVTL